MRRFFIVLLLLCLTTACQPQGDSGSAVQIPTLAVLPAAPTPELDSAVQVALSFLDSWKAGDFAAMYRLISFTSQEAMPYDQFEALYQQSAQTMTLQTLTYQGTNLSREGAVALLNYDVTFSTLVLGEFSDQNRIMRLIFDSTANDWRVAWSPGDIFAEMEEGGRLRLRPIIPPRANIYDRDGMMTLADQNGRVAMVNITRERIPDYEGCLAVLAAALNQPLEELRTEIESRPANWLLDIGTLDPTAWETHHESLEASCAAEFEGRSVRRYPLGPAVANLIGYVGFPDETDVAEIQAAGFEQDTIIGKSGIERSWDSTLRGQPGGELTIVTASGEVLREVMTRRSQPPQSLWLTIDSDLQQGVARILEEAYRSGAVPPSGLGASVVVMDVNTGEVLAMVTYPSFDNNAFTPYPEMGSTEAERIIQRVQSDPLFPQLNRPTQGAYPLGSVMKLVTSMAAADSGVYGLEERFTCTGIWSRDITRYDWNSGHGTLTLPQAITQSCNPYYYEAGYRLDSVDPYLLPSYARMVGFGARTGQNDLSEADGLIVDPAWWRVNLNLEWNFSEAVNMSIGQGYFQVNPLQVTRMVAAIANNGTLYRPQFVRQVGLFGGTPSFTAEPVVDSTLDVRPEVLDMIRGGMCDVTTTALGTAVHIFRDSPVQSIGVCGKTGTAQAPPNPISHAWFAAYAPRENPEIAVVVMVEHGNEGSGTAAPIARDVFEYYFFEREGAALGN